MSTIDEVAVEIHENGKSLKRSLKDKAFDVIGVLLIVAVSLISLGAIELREITWKEIIDMFLEAVPVYISAVTLSMNYYRKGVYAGKETEMFTSAIKRYSNKVNNLSGKRLTYLSDFCGDYNDKALKTIQENLLRSVGISYERFNNDWIDGNGEKQKALKNMSKQMLIRKFNSDVADAVIKARQAKIKGLSPNLLLGSNYSGDITDLGHNEKELLKQRRKQYFTRSAMAILLLSFIAIKNIIDWGWIGFVLIAFKLVWVLCDAYMKYFDGYDDITIKLLNHISRKVDVFKQYDYWYYLRHPNEFNLSDPEYEWLSNISDNSIIYYNNDGCKTGDDGTSPKNVEGVLNE